MRGKRARELRKAASILYTKVILPHMREGWENLTNAEREDRLAALPTPRQVYRKLKRRYTHGRLD